jgi:hemolysin III
MYAGERFNSITHLIGAVLAVAGTGALIAIGAKSGSVPRVTALAVYGFMLIFLYTSSTLYHSLRGKAKEVFHVFDHCAIYLLIAGTYTPFTLLVLHGAWRWSIFTIVWTLALAGVLKDTLFRGRYRAVSVVLYVLMGWLIAAAAMPLKAALPSPGLMWLGVGGVVYTVGIAFYAMSKRVAYSHGMWHLFAMGGSICHYVAVVKYVA